MKILDISMIVMLQQEPQTTIISYIISMQDYLRAIMLVIQTLYGTTIVALAVILNKLLTPHLLLMV